MAPEIRSGRPSSIIGRLNFSAIANGYIMGRVGERDMLSDARGQRRRRGRSPTRLIPASRTRQWNALHICLRYCYYFYYYRYNYYYYYKYITIMFIIIYNKRYVWITLICCNLCTSSLQRPSSKLRNGKKAYYDNTRTAHADVFRQIIFIIITL